MKKLIFGLACLLLIMGNACTPIDNYDGPNAELSGKITDKSTGKPFLLDQGGLSIRMWETSWTATTPSPRDLVVKQDGTYAHTKLFQATYDIVPYQGAFWPVTDTIKGFQLTGAKTIDFELTPYVHIIDLQHSWVENDSLQITWKLEAPITAGMPNIREMRPFLSLTKFCGNGNRIDYYYNNNFRIAGDSWSALAAPGTPNITRTFTFERRYALPLDKGKTYNVRIGAQINNSSSSWNYSDIFTVVVP